MPVVLPNDWEAADKGGGGGAGGGGRGGGGGGIPGFSSVFGGFGGSRGGGLTDAIGSIYGNRRRKLAMTSGGYAVPVGDTSYGTASGTYPANVMAGASGGMSYDQGGGGGGYASPGGDMSYSQGGDPSGGYNPSDPFGFYTTPSGGGLNYPAWQGLAVGNVIGRGGQSGMYDPSGGGAWLDAIQNWMNQRGGAQQRAAITGARARNIDPSMLPLLQSQAQIGADQGTADLLGQARVSHAEQVQSWINDFLNTQLGVQNQMALGTQQNAWDNAARRNAARQHWMDVVGGLASSGAKAYASRGIRNS